jgi:hypothetical protein
MRPEIVQLMEQIKSPITKLVEWSSDERPLDDAEYFMLGNDLAAVAKVASDALDELDRLRPLARAVPVGEGLPANSEQTVLLRLQDGGNLIGHYSHNYERWYTHAGGGIFDINPSNPVTHWQTIAKPGGE